MLTAYDGGGGGLPTNASLDFYMAQESAQLKSMVMGINPAAITPVSASYKTSTAAAKELGTRALELQGKMGAVWKGPAADQAGENLSKTAKKAQTIGDTFRPAAGQTDDFQNMVVERQSTIAAMPASEAPSGIEVIKDNAKWFAIGGLAGGGLMSAVDYFSGQNKAKEEHDALAKAVHQLDQDSRNYEANADSSVPASSKKEPEQLPMASAATVGVGGAGMTAPSAAGGGGSGPGNVGGPGNGGGYVSQPPTTNPNNPPTTVNPPPPTVNPPVTPPPTVNPPVTPPPTVNPPEHITPTGVNPGTTTPPGGVGGGTGGGTATLPPGGGAGAGAAVGGAGSIVGAAGGAAALGKAGAPGLSKPAGSPTGLAGGGAGAKGAPGAGGMAKGGAGGPMGGMGGRGGAAGGGAKGGQLKRGVGSGSGAVGRGVGGGGGAVGRGGAAGGASRGGQLKRGVGSGSGVGKGVGPGAGKGAGSGMVGRGAGKRRNGEDLDGRPDYLVESDDVWGDGDKVSRPVLGE